MPKKTENRCRNCGADLNVVGRERMGTLLFCASCKRSVGSVEDPRRQQPDGGRRVRPPARGQGQKPI